MRIRDIHVEVFGLLRDVTIRGLAPRLNVFLGDNESGKTTLLDFCRAVLTGFPVRPAGRDKAYRDSGSTGGTLTLDTERGMLSLTRHPGPGGGEPQLMDAAGQPVDRSEWDRLMGGITREIYNAIYGFSLTELERMETLDSAQVRSALYGSSFGAGLGSPNAAMDKLKKEMDGLFKPGGSTQPVAKTVSEWNDLDKEILDARHNLSRYDGLAAEKETLAAQLEALKNAYDSRERERLRLERTLTLWRQWDEWRQCGMQLDELPPLPDTLPENGFDRLRQLEERLDAATDQASQAKGRFETASRRLAAISVDDRLADALPEIQRIGGFLSGWVNAVQELPHLEAEQRRIAEELARGLASLGPGWTEEKIYAAAPTFTRREMLSRREEELSAAASAAEAADSELRSALRAEEASRQARDLAQAALFAIPLPVFTLSAQEQGQFQRTLARAEEAAADLPEAKRLQQDAASALDRAKDTLRIAPDTDTRTALQGLEKARDEAHERAKEALLHENAVEEKQRLAEKLEREAADAAEGRDLLVRRKDALQAPDRTSLDSLRIKVRQLRGTTAQLAPAEALLAGLEEQCAEQKKEKTTPHLFFAMLAGAVLACGGAAVAIRGWDPQAVGTGLPLTVWPGLVAVLAGLLLLSFSRARAAKEQKQQTRLTEKLNARRDGAAARVQALRADINKLSQELPLPVPDSGEGGIDPTHIDALENLLDEQRERMLEAERIEREIRLQSAEAHRLDQAALAATEELAAAEEEALAARRRWQELFMRHGLNRAPEPDEAELFFTRLDTARAALETLDQRTAETASLRSRIGDLASLAANLPDGHRPADNAASDMLFASVRALLEHCREADRITAEHHRAKQSFSEAAARFESDARCRIEAEKRSGQATASLDAAREQWRSLLADMGLDPDLSPATARDAVQCIVHMGDLLTERDRREHDARLRRKEAAAFAEPLTSLCASFGREAGEAPRAAFDTLLADSQEASEVRTRASRLKEETEEREQEWREAENARQAAEKRLQELLDLGHTDSRDEFIRLVGLAARKNELANSRNRLETELRLAARDEARREGHEAPDDAAFASWLNAFDGNDPDALSLQLETLEQELKELKNQQDDTLKQAHGVDITLRELRSSNDLAALRQKQEGVAAILRGHALAWTRLALARQMIEQAKTRFERERQPAVIREASRLFSLMTNGAWSGLTSDLDSNALTALPSAGEPMPAELLSRGTREQLYLALRFAHISLHNAPPLIMDDILVNFDPGRARSTAALLAAETPSAGIGDRQVLFFTCHPQTAEMLAELADDVALFTMTSGTVARS